MKTIILFLSAVSVATVGLFNIQNQENAPLVQDGQFWLNACMFKLPEAQQELPFLAKEEEGLKEPKIDITYEYGCCMGCIYDEGIGEELPDAPKEVVGMSPNEDSIILCYVEQMPMFPGGDLELRKYLAKNIRYPNTAGESCFGGSVLISFIVNEDGRLSDFTILRDIGGGLGEAALAVVKEMPTWIPGKQNGKNVKVKFMLPVKFCIGSCIDQKPSIPTSGPCAVTHDKISTSEPEEEAENKHLEVLGAESENTLRFYPNPCRDMLTIESDDSAEQLVQIFDLNGKLCKRFMFNGLTTIDVQELGAAGMYVVRAGSKSYKVVVE